MCTCAVYRMPVHGRCMCVCVHLGACLGVGEAYCDCFELLRLQSEHKLVDTVWDAWSLQYQCTLDCTYLLVKHTVVVYSIALTLLFFAVQWSHGFASFCKLLLLLLCLKFFFWAAASFNCVTTVHGLAENYCRCLNMNTYVLFATLRLNPTYVTMWVRCYTSWHTYILCVMK